MMSKQNITKHQLSQFVGKWNGDSSELDVVKEKSGWMSVKDRLPEVPERCSMDVIIYFNSHVVIGCYTGDNQWFQYAGFSHYAPRTYMLLGDQIGTQLVYDISSDLVTHWQPLPEPPENE